MNFIPFKKQVQANLASFDKNSVFYVEIDRDKIWEVYLNAFPESERQSHNCNCCKSFLRQFAGIVQVKDGALRSIWDGITGEFESIAKALSKYVKSLPVTDVFIPDVAKAGTDSSYDGKAKVTWQHFFLDVSSYRNTNCDTIKGEFRATRDVFRRGLTEISLDALETVLELATAGSIYRGNEHVKTVKDFIAAKKAFDKAKSKDLFAWEFSNKYGMNVTRVRNTSIGTLLTDLSEGKDLDKAVASFEKMVAPQNYKRPTALVTPKMIEEARKKLEELGLEKGLYRRFAEQSDISVSNLLWTGRGKAVKSLWDTLSEATAVDPKKFGKVDEMPINDFIDKVLPLAQGIELLAEGSHLNNLVTLITENEEGSPKLFKWDNPFSWCYTGGLTDSIKEKVKKAGGDVSGPLRISLSWKNSDDLDLGIVDPRGFRTYFGNKAQRHANGSMLDVDANFMSIVTDPVENIIFNKVPIDGTYRVHVTQYTKRTPENQGYTVEIEFLGQVFQFSYHTNKGEQFTFILKDGQIILPDGAKSSFNPTEKWGISTYRWLKVPLITLSPNYWDGTVGNKHFFFFVEGAKNDEKIRPIFNEFLRGDLDAHRKVLEMIGGKLEVQSTAAELSGFGFSETVRNSVFVRVSGKTQRIIKITF